MTCWVLTPVRKLTTIFAAGLFLFAAASMSAQTFNVIYNFTGGTDGGDPVGGLAIDAAGNLYGSAFTGGAGYGTTYELSPSGSGWTFNTLYSFLGFPANDGAGPTGIYLAPNGALIGETQAGGKSCRGLPQYDGCGTVYELTPPPRTERVLYRFTGGLDGIAPYGLQPVAQHGGDFYSTTFQGGAYGSCIYGYALSLIHIYGCVRYQVGAGLIGNEDSHIESHSQRLRRCGYLFHARRSYAQGYTG